MTARQIILDTETTGLNFKGDDRVIEIGCLELVNRSLTGNSFHRYLNPDRDSDPGALAVHGLTRDFLSDKPRFGDVVDELCDFLDGAEILIHNASFDVGFLNAELARLQRPAFGNYCEKVIDTLAMAKELHPGKRNSLDALCERYGISNAHRTLHGALLDASLLAEVYLAMTRGQDSLVIDIEPAHQDFSGGVIAMSPGNEQLIVLHASEADQREHEACLEAIRKESKSDPVWFRTAIESA